MTGETSTDKQAQDVVEGREPVALDFESFAAARGASRLSIGDAGLHNPAGHMPASNWRRLLDLQAKKDATLLGRRAELRVEYNALVMAGEIRPLTRRERLRARADGEGPAAEAARRLLAKLDDPPAAPDSLVLGG